ncbi:MAG TPA: nucleoside hydrolase [Candidatus Scybalocola faecipullorum]|nr:nucleoside hydrolase [Candidatus Scybalocola faecipullorum]
MDSKREVVIDCDPGIDDALALMLALGSKDIRVVGITVVCGNVGAALGTVNVCRILELMGRTDIPVIMGAAKPLNKPLVTAQDTHGMDGLGEAGYGCMDETLLKRGGWKSYCSQVSEVVFCEDEADNPAAHWLVQKFASTPGLSLIALGPMTNIASAMQMDLEAFKNMGHFVSMGGSYKSHGNCSPVAEFNYWADPDAAAWVYANSPVKIHMVGLDVTRRIVLTPDICSLIGRFDDPKAEFILNITKFYTDFHWHQEKIIGCVINDPLAVAYMIGLCRQTAEEPTLCSGFESYVAVQTEGLGVGQTIVDGYRFWNRPANAVVLTDTDPKVFMSLFLKTIFPSYSHWIDIGMKEVYHHET